jgi:hypothetical protein
MVTPIKHMETLVNFSNIPYPPLERLHTAWDSRYGHAHQAHGVTSETSPSTPTRSWRGFTLPGTPGMVAPIKHMEALVNFSNILYLQLERLHTAWDSRYGHAHQAHGGTSELLQHPIPAAGGASHCLGLQVWSRPSSTWRY